MMTHRDAKDDDDRRSSYAGMDLASATSKSAPSHHASRDGSRDLGASSATDHGTQQGARGGAGKSPGVYEHAAFHSSHVASSLVASPVQLKALDGALMAFRSAVATRGPGGGPNDVEHAEP